MKQAIAAGLALLVGVSVLADVPTAPTDVRLEFTGRFDAKRVFTGTFIASGGINEVGPWTGRAVNSEAP